MAIKVKAVERNVSFDKNSEKWADDVLDNPREVTADEDGVTYTAVFEKVD